jgi:hypothetical protein
VLLIKVSSPSINSTQLNSTQIKSISVTYNPILPLFLFSFDMMWINLFAFWRCDYWTQWNDRSFHSSHLWSVFCFMSISFFDVDIWLLFDSRWVDECLYISYCEYLYEECQNATLTSGQARVFETYSTALQFCYDILRSTSFIAHVVDTKKSRRCYNPRLPSKHTHVFFSYISLL